MTTSQNNFTETVDKADKVELAIKAGLVHEATPSPTNSSKTVPKRAAVTLPEANQVHTIEVPRPN